jgi:predicted permease
VTHDFLSVLGVNPAQGRFFAADEGAVDTPARVVVLSHDFWAEAFGAAPGIVGGSVAINDTAYTVIGVAEQGFRGLDVSMTDVFLPLGTYPDVGQPALGLSWFEWGGSLLRAVARLSTPDAEAVLTGRATAGYRAQPEIPRYLIDRTNVVLAGPIVQARGPGQLEGPIPISIRTAGVAAVVLLIACANVASLLLVRATRRRRELAVRLTLGVSRGRLFGQLLTESVALGSVAGAAACLVGVWGGSVLRGLLLPSVAWARPLVESRTVLLVMLVAAGGGLLAGLAPALSGSKADASSALKSGAHGSGGRWLGARSLLLVVQGALSIVLVVGAALFVRSLGRLDALDLGYDTDRLVRASVTMRGERPNAAAIRETSERIAALPGVTGVALASSMPMSGWSGATVYIAGRQMPLTDPSAIFIRVTPEFFEVAGMALQEGRTFERGEGAVAVVNETLARTLAPGGSAVGQCLLLGDADAECTRVIGVSEDARRGQILEEQRPQFFVPLNEGRETAILARFSGDGRPIAAAARSKLERTFEPGIVRVERMSDALATQLRPWRLGAQLFSGFGLLALVVTSVGVYSVMAYTVSQRTHEMGVRIALGARVHDVLRLVLRDGLRVIGLAIAVGIVAALVLGRLVASLLYRVTPRDPVAMGAAAAVLLAVGLLACLIPAWRAARVDPVRALSAE